MPIELWPLLRPFLVMAIMLAAMYEPKRKNRKQDAVRVPMPDKEEIYDAEYEQLD